MPMVVYVAGIFDKDPDGFQHEEVRFNYLDAMFALHEIRQNNPEPIYHEYILPVIVPEGLNKDEIFEYIDSNLVGDLQAYHLKQLRLAEQQEGWLG